MPTEKRAGSEKHPLASIVVCTRGLRPSVVKCIESLLAQDCRRSEIILVLNGEPDPQLVKALGRFPITVLEEPRRGVCIARNRAIPKASGGIFICVDDDVVAHPGWLHELLKGFGDPRVACVTGGINMEGSSFLQTEKAGRLKAWEEAPTCWTLDRSNPDWYEIGIGMRIGYGCNMAFRKEFLETYSFFPERLGAGSLIGGHDEGYMFLQVLKNGFRIHYTPFAKVTHSAEADPAKLKGRMKQLYTGNVAYMLTMLASEKGYVGATLKFYLGALMRRMRRVAARRTIASEPQELLTPSEKIRAYLAGPLLLWKERRRATGKRRNP